MNNNPINYITADMNFSALNPCTCGSHKCPPSHSYGPAARSYWLLHFVIKGKGIFQVGGEKHEVTKNSMFIIKPFEVTYYIADKDEPWEYIWIGFYCDGSLPTLLKNSAKVAAPELKNAFEQAAKPPFSLESGRGYEQFLCSKIWEIFAFLTKLSEIEMSAAVRYVDDAKKIFDNEYVNNITVSDVAHRLHLNRTYLSSIFKNIIGVSPAEYLFSARMKKAMQLLTEHGCTVSVTSASVGYTDVFVFSRAFKKHFGAPPVKFKKDV